MKPKIVCIVGATASGKTDISIRLAQKLNTEIISADSMQVYKHMNIGSGKPTAEEKQGIVHHLMDCMEINTERYSVSEYKRLASDIIHSMTSKAMLPIIVGGTGLYINSLTYPLSFADVDSDEALRQELKEKEAQNPGILHSILTDIDPITAQRLHKNDIKRIIRALEVNKLSGKPLSEHGNDFRNKNGAEIEFDPIIIGITMPREMLYQRIEARVDNMMRRGLYDEVMSIIKLSGFSEDLPSMQGLGYKQLIAHILHGTPETLDETVDKIKLETRHFAKRQLTWFRRDDRIKWFDITQHENGDVLANAIADTIRRENG